MVGKTKCSFPHNEAFGLRGVQKPSNCKGLRVGWLLSDNKFTANEKTSFR